MSEVDFESVPIGSLWQGQPWSLLMRHTLVMIVGHDYDEGIRVCRAVEWEDGRSMYHSTLYASSVIRHLTRIG